jgi:hypothetical protein
MKINPMSEYDHPMAMMKILNPEESQLTIDDQGNITIDDPGSPLLVAVRTDSQGRLCHLSITTRHPTGRITQAALSRLPLPQIQRLAAAIRTDAPDEAWWTAAASLKPAGSRSWPEDHWNQVLAVATWAKNTHRPGGPATAIAELWGVAKAPTAYRWLKTAQQRAASHFASNLT